MALWLLLTSTIAGNQVGTGLIASALAATAWHVVAGMDRLELRNAAQSWQWFAWTPLRVVADTWRATRALVLHFRGATPGGTFVELALSPAGSRAERDSRHALLVLLV